MLDKLSGGFVISDQAATIEGALSALAGDASIKSIVATDGPVLVSEAAFAANRLALDKVVNGFGIVDTAADIVSSLASLTADAANIASLQASDVSPVVTAAQFAASQSLLDKLPGGFAVSDTGANLLSELSALTADAIHIDRAIVASGAVAAGTGATLSLKTGIALENDGLLNAAGGSLTVFDAVTGSGSALISNGGALKFKSAFNENVAFSGSNAGTLSLAQPYAGTISGFAVGDAINLLGHHRRQRQFEREQSAGRQVQRNQGCNTSTERRLPEREVRDANRRREHLDR